MRDRRWLPLLLLAALTGCGYHPAGQGARLPASIHTLAIPSLVNKTQTYRIEQTMTAAVVREFISRSRFQVLLEDSPQADAVLSGAVLSAQVAPLTYDSQTGRASSAQVTVTLRVSLVDRSGKVLYENPNYVFREQYQVSREISSFFEEESPSLDRMARDFARTLVADILENY
jgi:outer membrane lipopolysaccharide assembly protein LptE/RlpB